MNKLSFRIAWRYLFSTQYEKNIATMIQVCCVSIFIGAFALALVMAVMTGFETAIYEKMQGIHAQIIMKSPTNEPLNYQRIRTVLASEFPAVATSSASSFGNIILQPEDSNDISNALVIRAINPRDEEQTTTLGTKIIAPNKATLASCIQHDGLLIGSSYATQRGLAVGDTVTVVYMNNQPNRTNRVHFDSKTATIAGIFKTGIDEIDDSVVFCTHDYFNSLFPDTGITQINIRLKPGSNESATIAQLKERFDLDVYTWKDMYLPLVAALKLEAYVMFFILALIMLVASMNIISLLFMQITRKRGDIAILKAMGTSDRMIRHIFLIMGTGITCTSAAAGLLSAWGVGLLLQHYPFITLPDVYYVSYLPVSLDLTTFVGIFCFIVLMTIIATLLPLRTIKHINIATLLRFEA